MDSLTLAVIMVGRELWSMTRQAMESLIFTMNVPWRFVFVNNGSTDETHEMFNKVAKTWSWPHFEGYDYIRYKRPMPLATAWNKAFTKAATYEPEYTCFANNDIVFHQHGWWTKFQEFIDAGYHLAGIQDMSWYRFRFIEGSLLAAKTSTFRALAEKVTSGTVHVFDQRFKLSCEDVDLSHRALRAGLQIGQVSGLQPEWLVHIGHQTLQHFGPSEDLYDAMHSARRSLCKKWGVPEKIED